MYTLLELPDQKLYTLLGSSEQEIVYTSLLWWRPTATTFVVAMNRVDVVDLVVDLVDVALVDVDLDVDLVDLKTREVYTLFCSENPRSLYNYMF